jgi:hypothetical protein
MPLEKADISKLLATGWKPPMQIKMMAADGKTGDLRHALPADELRSVEEVSDHQSGVSRAAVGQRRDRARSPRRAATSRRSPSSGFVVVSIDGTGTPNRSKAYTDAYYGAMGRTTRFPDQIAGMKELAKKYSVDRHRQGGDVGPLGRRLHHRGRACCGRRTTTSSRSASPSRQPRSAASTKTTGASATRGRS